MKAIYPFLFVTLLSFGAWTDVSESEFQLEWNDDRLLTWDDFQGSVNLYSNADAATAVRIAAKPNVKGRKIKYDVNAYFIKNQSWYRTKSEQLLRHEQLHFDLAELYARKIRKQISDYQKRGVRDIRLYNTAIKRLLEESNRIDRSYDDRTIHGALSDKQKIWEKNIRLQLHSLDHYSQYNWEQTF